MYTCSTSVGLIPALLIASLITSAPSSAAGIPESDPPMVPIAVRHAPAKTTFFDINLSPYRLVKNLSLSIDILSQ
jgi:hypothetical protein